MSVLQFVEDAKQDLESPSTSPFPSKMAAYKNMVSGLDEVLDVDRGTTQKFKKSVKAMHSSAQAFISNELAYAENMEKLGSLSLSREAETGIGTAFLKFSVITKEISHMTKTLYGNYYNMVLFPLDSLLKGDMKSLNDLKRPFDDSWKDLKAKGTKAEKEARKKTQEIVLYRIDPPEASCETFKERKSFMYQSCEYLIKANEVKVKKGVELVQHLIEYYHAQLQYFHRGMELLENMRSYFEGLAAELQQLRTRQDDERKVLVELRNQLKTVMLADKAEAEKKPVYSLHGQQGVKEYGTEKLGTILKRSEGVRKQWQKRYIVVKNGQFKISHSSTSNRNVILNLLTCQVKPAAEKDAKKNAFALVTQNRTYLFQAEDENDYEAWVSVISNAREEALKKAFGDGDDSLSKDSSSIARNLKELTESIVSEVQKLPENDVCVDCGASDPTWFSTNLGILVCIECSGIHREMGVHISRIRSLTLDKLGTAELLLTKAVGNGGFNEIMEAELDFCQKPSPTSNMEQRKEFINSKYILRKFVHKSDSSPDSLLQDLNHAISSRDILALLQLYAEGVDLAKPIPDYKCNGTALHHAVEQEDLTSLHLVDFLIQNSSNIDVKNTDGNTALHLAVSLNKPECVKLLLRGGASHSVENKEGRTPLSIGKEQGVAEILEVLKDVQEGKIQKLDNVKIDWGIDQADGIYENPLDLVDLKIEFKEENEDHPDKVNSSLPSATKTPKSKTTLVKRSESLNSSSFSRMVPKTFNNSPLSASSITSTPGRHSVAVKPPSPTSSERSLASGTEQAPQLPPPPPVRKSVKQSDTGSIKAEHWMSGAGSTGILSTFASKPPSNLSTQSLEKGLPPPTPPARTTSSMPRPERPVAPSFHPKRHQRNASDGAIVDVFNVAAKDQSFKFPEHKDKFDRVVPPPETSLRKRESLPPPLPPPRPKGRPESKTMESPSKTVTPVTPARAPSYDKSNEVPKVKNKRAKALYDCEADHDDELEFKEGDTIIVYGEADPEWLFGEVEGKPGKKGVFPINFVHVLNS